MVDISKINSENSNEVSSIKDYLIKINKLLNLNNQNELVDYTKNLHNADIADIIQNLNEDNRSKFINKIVNGNSLEILKTIPNKTFDLIFADPPYNLQIGEKLKRPDDSKVNGVDDKWDRFKNFEHYDNFSKAWLTECKRILKDNGSIWVIGSYHNIFRLGSLLQLSLIHI